MLTVHVKFGNEREGHCKIQKEIESVQRTFEIYRVINKVIYIAYHRHFARSQRQKYKILALLNRVVNRPKLQHKNSPW